MKKEMFALSFSLLLLIILFSGCAEKESVTTLTATEIRDNMLQAVENNVSSYKYSANIKATSTMINESGTFTTERTGIQIGEVDIVNKKLKQNNTAITKGMSERQHWIVYLLDNIRYYGAELDGSMKWNSSNISHTDSWIAYSALEAQAMAFKSLFKNIDVKRLADETVNDVDCYVLNITANFKNQSIYENVSQEYGISYWIAKDTYFLIKVHSGTTVDRRGWYTSGKAYHLIAVTEMDTVFSDYNLSVTIEVPPEAKK